MEDDTCTGLFIGDISFTCTEEQLRKAFECFGLITAIRIKRGKGKQHSSYGFIEFTTMNEAFRAMHEMDGKILGGAKIRVSWASKKQGPAKNKLEGKSKKLHSSDGSVDNMSNQHSSPSVTSRGSCNTSVDAFSSFSSDEEPLKAMLVPQANLGYQSNYQASLNSRNLSVNTQLHSDLNISATLEVCFSKIHPIALPIIVNEQWIFSVLENSNAIEDIRVTAVNYDTQGHQMNGTILIKFNNYHSAVQVMNMLNGGTLAAQGIVFSCQLSNNTLHTLNLSGIAMKINALNANNYPQTEPTYMEKLNPYGTQLHVQHHSMHENNALPGYRPYHPLFGSNQQETSMNYTTNIYQQTVESKRAFQGNLHHQNYPSLTGLETRFEEQQPFLQRYGQHLPPTAAATTLRFNATRPPLSPSSLMINTMKGNHPPQNDSFHATAAQIHFQFHSNSLPSTDNYQNYPAQHDPSSHLVAPSSSSSRFPYQDRAFM